MVTSLFTNSNEHNFIKLCFSILSCILSFDANNYAVGAVTILIEVWDSMCHLISELKLFVNIPLPEFQSRNDYGMRVT